MPAAGAIIPPQVIPLREPVPGVPSNHIDTETFIELETETPECKIYFTTDGTKPNPLQRMVAKREVTFKYRGPFTLKAGKRTLKVMAVSRDSLKESNVVTRTFVVDGIEEIGRSDPLVDSMFDTGRDSLIDSELESVDSYKPVNRSFTATKSRKTPTTSNALVKKKAKSSLRKITGPKEAWSATTMDYTRPFVPNTPDYPPVPEHVSNAAQMPDSSNPVNYSGTQINFWGCAPNVDPGNWLQKAQNQGQQPYGNPWGSQLGSMTNNMIQGLNQPTISLEELKRLYAQASLPHEWQDPEYKPNSEGQGDWREQLKHIHAHLIEECKNDLALRNNLGEPKLGKIIHADFDEQENNYVLTVSIAKVGVRKPKPKVPATPPVAPPPVVKKPPTPAPVLEPKPPMKFGKTVKTAMLANKLVNKQAEKPKEKPKLDPEPKKKDLTKEDPYFVQEDYQADGTLKPWPAFNVERDCEKLRAAMKGMGTDEKALIDVLGYRSSVQREEICVMFKTMFGKDLRDELAGETSGNFQRLLKALCLPACDYDAYECNRAIKGLGTEEDCLIEILCTRTNSQIQNLKAVYKRLYGRTLEEDVKGDTSGYFRRILLSIMAGGRDEVAKYDLTAAKADARALFEAGEGKWGTDESKFVEIMCARSFPHLRAVFEQYKVQAGKDFEDAIKAEFSGDIKNSLLAVVRVIKSKPAYFAQKLQKAMKGLGTDDEAVVRICVCRAECDMVQIKDSFKQQFNGDLASWIQDDTSGDYKGMILALIGERPPPQITAEEKAEAEEEQEIEEVEEEKIVEEGTLKPAERFDPKADCEVLRKAMKGLGTDEDAVISVMAHRSLDQRMELVKTYQSVHGKNLQDELKSETSGNFKTILAALCVNRTEFDCTQLKKAMKGLGTDEDCLIEICCTRSNQEIEEICKLYKQMYNKKLEEDIVDDTSGHLKRILVSMVQAHRPQTGNTVNRTKARKDAKDLYEAGDKKFGTDESRFNVILCSRSYPQLRATFEEYAKAYGKDIEQVIDAEMSGDLKKAMLTVVRCIRNKAQQFAKSLYEAMHGLGTNDESLVRTVVTRCEVDMVQIKQHFTTMYKGSVGEWIRDDTSGDYRKILLHLIAEESLANK